LFAFSVAVFVFNFIFSSEGQSGLKGAVRLFYEEQMKGQRCGVERERILKI